MKFSNQVASTFVFSLAASLLTPGIYAKNCTLTVVGEQKTSNLAAHNDLHLLSDLSLDCDRSDTIAVNLPHGNSKVFQRTLSEVPPFEEAAAYWSGEDLEDGSEFDYIRGEDGTMYGTLVDVSNGNVVDISANADGTPIVTITAASDFPEEEEEEEGEEETDGRGDEEVNTNEASETQERNLRGGRRTASMHAVTQVPEQKGEHDAPVADIGLSSEVSAIVGDRRQLLDDSGGNIDIMVVWTKRAECMASTRSPRCTLTERTRRDMLVGVVERAVQETNDAFQKSGVLTRLNLVHAYRHPTYEDSRSSKTELNRIRNRNDGHMDDVHSKRMEYGADLVALISDLDGSCGRASINAQFARAFSVTSYKCIGNKSFAHEIGHNLGCNHNRADAGSNGDRNASYFGYQDPNSRFRSILAYNCPGRGCTRLNRFSSPRIRYQGSPIGDARHDNVKQINSVRARVAAFTPHKGGGYNSYRNGQFPSMCLDLSRADATNMNDVWLYRCNGTPAQKWKLDSNGFLRSRVNQNKCLVPAGDASIFSSIVIYDCSDRFTHMKWYRDSRGRFVLKSNGKCLDVSEQGGTSFSKVLQIYNCNDRSDKIWNPS